MDKIWNADITDTSEDVGQRELSPLQVGTQRGAATLEDGLLVSCKADELIPCDPAVVLLGIYPKELKMYVPGKTSTRMFIKALFKIANTWKQPRCPSVGGWIVKLWSIQTMGYYSTLSCSTNRQGGLFSTGKK